MGKKYCLAPAKGETPAGTTGLGLLFDWQRRGLQLTKGTRLRTGGSSKGQQQQQQLARLLVQFSARAVLAFTWARSTLKKNEETENTW